MYLYILYLFVYTLEDIDCWQPPTTRRHDHSFNPYLGAAKSAKLINLVQKINNNGEYPLRVVGEDVINKESTVTPSVFDSMKLMQKNYDVSRKFNKDQRKHVNLQFISNPEVLEMYRKQPVRRNDEYYDVGDLEPRSYKDEAVRSGRPALHKFGTPVKIKEYRKHIKLASTISSELEERNADNNSDDDVEDDVRRNNFYYRDHENDPKSEISAEETDVTLKPEETFDIVKPFIEQMLNDIKERGRSEETNKNSNSDDQDDFYVPQKVLSSAEKEKENVEKELLERVLLVTKKDSGEPTETLINEGIDVYIKGQENENTQRSKKDLAPIFHGEVEAKNAWRKKELDKYADDNISKEKQNGNGDILGNSKDLYDDKDWMKKKLPVSKKSFIEPALTREDIDWDDKGFGYVKETDWDKKEKKETANIDSSEWKDNKFDKNKDNGWENREKKKKKDDFDVMSIIEKKYSSENKKENKVKKNVKMHIDNNWGGKKTEWGQYNNKKIEKDKKDDDWDKGKIKTDEWTKDKAWNEKEDSWNKKEDSWNKKDNRWNKKDDWDKKEDSWNKKNDDGHGMDDWSKREDKFSKKNDWNEKGDNWNKKNDDWNKKDDDWNKKDDDWNSKGDNWNKKGDRNKKGDSWNKKKDEWNKNNDGWNTKNVKVDRKLPDNQKRDSGWDLVGLGNNEKKKNRYADLGSYEGTGPKKISYNKDENLDTPKKKYSSKKTNDQDEPFVPKFYNTYEKPRKAKRQDSYERKSARSGLGRTPIPFVGNKAVYAD